MYYTILPSARLKNFIRSFWVLESAHPYTHYAMADVCPELIFHYNGRFDELLANGKTEKSFSAGISGQTALTRKFYINKGFGIFGVYLYPQSVPLLFGLPSTAITDQMPDLHALLKGEGDRLQALIATVPDNNQRVKIIEDFVDRKLARNYKEDLPVFHSIRTIIQAKGRIRVNQLAKDHFLSERQFERRFLEVSGLSPKLFGRITRFQAAMAQYGTGKKSLAAVAYETGYYDQSHFIRDFREFSGHLPKEYFSGSLPATDWRM